MAAAYCATLLAALLAAAGLGLLPGWCADLLRRAGLPVLVGQAALGFSVFGLALFPSPGAERRNPGLTGLGRGAFLGAMALPFVLAARMVSPLPVTAAAGLALLIAVTAAGSAAAGAAYRSRGAAAAAAAVCLPGLLGFLAGDVFPRAAWLSEVSPFVAAAGLPAAGSGWWAGTIPGLGLLAAALACRGRSAGG
jgi:hypothetical protein